MVQVEIWEDQVSSKGKISINKPEDRKIASKVGSRGWGYIHYGYLGVSFALKSSSPDYSMAL